MNRTSFPRHQSGVALAVSLLLLFVMTLLAVSSFSNSHIQERSANNIRLQSMAFEAASAGASNAIQFFVDNPEIGADKLCGALNHVGWGPSDWVDMGDVGGASLQQRTYCIADAYPCTSDDAVDCGVRPPRSKLFIHSRGSVMAQGTPVSVRDVEVRIDIGNDWVTGDGCGALCFPGCEHLNGKKELVFPSSNVFQVDGESGPAITTGCDEFTDDVTSAIGQNRMDNYLGGVATSAAGSPWDRPDTTAQFRDMVRETAMEATGCMVGCYFEGNLWDNGNNEYGTYDNPQIVFVDGDASFGGNTSGAGILFVTGTLSWNGTPNWHGLMVSLGGNFSIDGGGHGGNPGSKEVIQSGGSVVMLNLEPGDGSFGEVAFQNTGGGNALYRYDCEMLQRARTMLLGQAAQNIWNPGCERGPQHFFDAGPTELIIASWRENVGWRENHWGE